MSHLLNLTFLLQNLVFKILFGPSLNLVFTGLVRKSVAALSSSLPLRLLIVSPGAAKEKQLSLTGIQTVHPEFKLPTLIAMPFLFFFVFGLFVCWRFFFCGFLFLIQSVLPNLESPFRSSCYFASFQTVSLKFGYLYLLAVSHPSSPVFLQGAATNTQQPLSISFSLLPQNGVSVCVVLIP